MEKSDLARLLDESLDLMCARIANDPGYQREFKMDAPYLIQESLDFIQGSGIDINTETGQDIYRSGKYDHSKYMLATFNGVTYLLEKDGVPGYIMQFLEGSIGRKGSIAIMEAMAAEAVSMMEQDPAFSKNLRRYHIMGQVPASDVDSSMTSARDAVRSYAMDDIRSKNYVNLSDFHSRHLGQQFVQYGAVVQEMLNELGLVHFLMHENGRSTICMSTKNKIELMDWWVVGGKRA